MTPGQYGLAESPELRRVGRAQAPANVVGGSYGKVGRRRPSRGRTRLPPFMKIAAFLVVLGEHVHEETVEATMAAVQQLRGVAGVTLVYDDVGAAITRNRQVREDVQREVLDRVR